MSEDEARLVKQAQAGDADAFTEIYQRYRPKIYRYIYFRVATEATAEDLTTEVFIRVVERIDEFEYRGRPLLAWLYTIARHLVADHHRQHGRTTWVELNEGIASDNHAEDPVHTTEVSLLQERMAVALEELTEEQRQVIILKFFEEFDNQTVAELLGKTVGAVKALQHRALASLHRLFADTPD